MSDITLQDGKSSLDENLKPVKVRGKRSSLELSQSGSGAKISGDLEVTGQISGKHDINLDDDITCDDITCDNLTVNTVSSFASSDLTITDSSEIHLKCNQIKIYDQTTGEYTVIIDAGDDGNDKTEIALRHKADPGDQCRISVDEHGKTTFSTADDDGAAADLIFDPDGEVYFYTPGKLYIGESEGSEQIEIDMNGTAGQGGYIKIMAVADKGDFCKLETFTNGVTTLVTVDDDGHDDADLTLDVDGDINLDSFNGVFNFQAQGVTYMEYTALGLLKIRAVADTDDFFSLNVANTGVTTISTNDDSDGNLADFILNIEGDIVLNSKNGVFRAKDNDVEFSPDKSAYAGMILGYTEMAYGTTNGNWATAGIFNVIQDNYDHGDGAEDHFLGVTFVVPPSNRVEIEVFLPYVFRMDGTFHLGLSTVSSSPPVTLKAKHENFVWDVDESDVVQLVQKWVIDGSDSGMAGGAWAAGETKTLYCMGKEVVSGGSILWGDGILNYGDMTMKATALPATIGDGT